jgi:hypothetical protein
MGIRIEPDSARVTCDNSLRGFLLEESPQFFSEDIPTTVLGTALTLAVLIAVQLIPVIIAQFFPCLNIAESENPNLVLDDVGCTVRITGVIDIPCSVLQGLAINVVTIIKEKDEGIPLSDALRCFLVSNLLPEIWENPRTFGDRLCGEYAFPVDAGFANAEPNLHGHPPCTLPVWWWGDSR